MPHGSGGRSELNGSCSEKSQKVQSINYKIGVILQKQIQCLNVEEKNTACSIAVDQRIVTTRFRNKLDTSYELMKHHDRLRTRFAHQPHKPNRETHIKQRNFSWSPKKDRQERSSDLRNDVSSETTVSNQRNNFSMKTFFDSSSLKNRPQTALELRTKQWTKNADVARERVVRAKSAPPKSWRNCSDIMRLLNSSPGTAGNSRRPLSRAKFFDAFDIEAFREFRTDEVEREKDGVNTFIESLESLKLEPWSAVPVQRKRDSFETVNKNPKNRREFSAFVTRVDSMM